jgi:hypothetical protein
MGKLLKLAQGKSAGQIGWVFDQYQLVTIAAISSRTFLTGTMPGVIIVHDTLSFRLAQKIKSPW